MPGSPAQTGYSAQPGNLTFWTGPTGAITNNQVLAEWVFPWTSGRIAGMEFNAAVAGLGPGQVQLDVLLNGTSVWGLQFTSRPTLSSTASGRFTQTKPPVTQLRYGDTLTVRVGTVEGTQGPARVSGSLALESQ